ncbi:hypothetical protein, partial [Erwinia sp. V71]|uniref:hypothetical protein n=1 Tax=Erwinia sp. V71 TaxID=3369424 RepID=UPI003F603354
MVPVVFSDRLDFSLLALLSFDFPGFDPESFCSGLPSLGDCALSAPLGKVRFNRWGSVESLAVLALAELYY